MTTNAARIKFYEAMNKFFKIGITAALFLGMAVLVHAQDASSQTGSGPGKITFPIAELGNCGSQVECRAYCDKTENLDACTAFAKEHNLISNDEADQNQKFSSVLKTGGPGGCTTIDACKAYCSVAQHQQECQDFAQAHGLIKPDDAAKLKKFQSLVSAGQTPGGCTTKDACETYCQDQSHKQECLDFTVKLGAISKDQANKIKQSGTTGPGGCNSKDACEAYCQQTEHQQECLDFAQSHGLPKFKDFQANLQNAGGLTGCLAKILGSDALSKIDTRNLNADQKAAIAKCRPSPGPQPSATGTPPHLPGANLPPGNLKDCLVKILGADAVANLNTKNLTQDQKAAIAKCRPAPPQEDHAGVTGQQTGDGQKPPLPPPPPPGPTGNPPPANLPPPPPHQSEASEGSGQPAYQYQNPAYGYQSH